MTRLAGRLVAALGLAAITLVGTGALPAAASPAAASPATASAAAPAQAATSIELVSPPDWVHEGEPYQARVRVTGAPAGATVDMVVYDAVETRRRFHRTLDGDLTDERFTLPEQAATPGSDGTVTLGFTPGDDGTRLPGRGVYPVEVRLRSGDETLDSVLTYLSFLNAATPEFVPLDVAALVDVAATPALQPDGSTVLPDDTLAHAVQRIEILGAARDVPLTLAPRPETLEALARGGPPALGVVEQLSSLARTHPVFARPFVDVDLAALERVGLRSEANAQADGGANVVRRRLGVEPTGGMWMSGDNFGADAARIIAELNINRIVVPPAAVDSGGLGADGSAGAGSGDVGDEIATVPLTPVTLGEGGPAAMVTDPLLAGHLVDSADDGMVAAHRFVADLASIWMEAPANQRGIVVHLPPDVDLDAEAVGAALAALGDGQAARAVPVDQVFEEVPPLEDGPTSVQLAPYHATDDLAPIASTLRQARSRVAGVGALLGDPRVTNDLEQSLLVSTGRETPNDARAAYVARADTELSLVSGAVDLPDEFRITLTSRSAEIPVQITNTSDRELQVLLTLDSDQLEFPDGDEVVVDLAANASTREMVRVRPRTSGSLSLDITVTSPDGSITLDETRFDVRSTAISGVGLVLSIGACLFLAVWWARHWRSVRRSRRLMPTGSIPSSPGDDPTDPPGDPSPVPDPGGPGAAGSPTTRPARTAPADGSAATVPIAGTAPRPRHGRAGPPDDGPDEGYRPAHMARTRTRSG